MGMGQPLGRHLRKIGAVFPWSIAYNIVRMTSSQVPIRDGDAGTNQTDVLVSGGIAPNKYKVPLSEGARWFLSSIAGVLDLKKLFAPSTIAVIVGLILGATPLIKHALIGENAPLRALQDSAGLIGGAAVPSMTLIMGGNVLKGRTKRRKRSGVVVVRYAALPLLGAALVKQGAAHLGVVQPDPLYQFILLLQYAVPPAMNIGTMAQLFGVGESGCAVIFVWAYALASVAVTAWSAVFLWTLSPP
ncbi:hypothetical protein BS78_02G225500 [Paspalum vaginatum]|nr:hypothetical protein BS78_02G225500 [Paspalum vaginatum]